MKIIIYSLLGLFILYTLYKVILIFVLNVTSLNTSYISHSQSKEISKEKGLFVGNYKLKQKLGSSINASFIPSELFIEREKIFYPNYYFYFGKSVIGNRFSVNGTIFSQLAKNKEHHITCKSCTQPSSIKSTVQNNLYFFYENIPSEIHFSIEGHNPKTSSDTLIYTLDNIDKAL